MEPNFMKAYRDYRELLADQENVRDHDEILRLERIKAIPESARKLMQDRVDTISRAVQSLEKERDELIDFLNGEVARR